MYMYIYMASYCLFVLHYSGEYLVQRNKCVIFSSTVCLLDQFFSSLCENTLLSIPKQAESAHAFS